MNVDKKHVVQLQGKDFITYDGLLDMAHQMGLLSIETELVDKDPYIFRAVAKTETQTFTGYGDADNENVNKMIAKHKIRMAETRAKARALRDLTNVGMCSVEEMGGDDADRHGNSTIYDKAVETFNSTPAEDIEITDDDMPASFKQAEEMFGGEAKKPASFITDNQQKRLFALAGYKEDKEMAKEIVQKLLDDRELKSTKEIKKSEYEEICQEAEVMLAKMAVGV